MTHLKTNLTKNYNKFHCWFTKFILHRKAKGNEYSLGDVRLILLLQWDCLVGGLYMKLKGIERFSFSSLVWLEVFHIMIIFFCETHFNQKKNAWN